MNIETMKLPQAIVEGARRAYFLDNPPEESPPFEAWLADLVEMRNEIVSNELVRELLELCRRAVNGESRTKLHTCSPQERDAIIVAHRALEGFEELERLALVGAAVFPKASGPAGA